jgi:hypothetical protein
MCLDRGEQMKNAHGSVQATPAFYLDLHVWSAGDTGNVAEAPVDNDAFVGLCLPSRRVGA